MNLKWQLYPLNNTMVKSQILAVTTQCNLVSKLLSTKMASIDDLYIIQKLKVQSAMEGGLYSMQYSIPSAWATKKLTSKKGRRTIDLHCPTQELGH